MYRSDARTAISVFIFISLLVHIYLLIENYSQRHILESRDAELRLELEALKTRYEELSVNVSNIRQVDSSVNSTIQHSEIIPSLSPKARRLVNIFVETSNLDNDELQAKTKRQFYKTFGSTGSGILFDEVKKLPEHLRKRVLVTGGAGFVGESQTISLR